MASMTIPAYLAEAAPPRIRGLLVTGFQLMITLGFFLASVVAGAFSYIDPYNTGWRLMFGIASLPAVVQLVGFYFLPESPRWLLMRGREEEARAVLMRINGEENEKIVEQEIEDIKKSHAEEVKIKEEGETRWVLLRMLQTPHVRKALFLGCSLQIFQQLSGVNTLMFYTASIVRMSGIRDPSTAIWMSCVVTGVNVLFTAVPIYFVEKLGRRKLLLASLIGVLLSLLLLGGGFALISGDCPHTSPWNTTNNDTGVVSDLHTCQAYKKSDDCVTQEKCGYCYPLAHNGTTNYGWCLPTVEGGGQSELGPCADSTLTNINDGSYVWAWNFCPTKFWYLPILGMVLFLSSFSTGLAPMPWVINSEIYPNWARSTGVSAATASNWIANLIISQTFLTLTEAITKYGAFFLYAGITLISFVLFYFTVPETKGLAVEDVEVLFGAEPKNKRGSITGSL